MHITPVILSIPPYVSTTWKNISSLYALPDAGVFKLVLILSNKMRVIVPHLDKASIDAIFEAHAKYGSLQPSSSTPRPEAFGAGVATADLFTSAMQHNPEQAEAPELPREILDKITSIAKVLGLDDNAQFPKPEENCNCPFCQIARAFQPQSEEMKLEEEVSLAELTFRNWDIQQSAEKLYIVSNPLDENEHYSVFLGEPLGCTCGQKNCEHIRAVLNT